LAIRKNFRSVTLLRTQFRPPGSLSKDAKANTDFRVKGNDKMTNTPVSSDTSIKAEPRSESSACCRDIGIRAVAAAVRYQRMPALSGRQTDAFPTG
jgi:hypothetical protein